MLAVDPQESCRWGGREGGEGGQSTVNLERIHKDFARITSDNVDLVGGLIDAQLGKDLQRHREDHH